MEPLFTIIKACYNAENTIERTIESVDSQTCKDYEHFIVDGASKDKTLEIIEKHPNELRTIMSESDKGLYDAMNKGIVNTRGTYLIFLNAGDKFHSPHTLENIKKAAVGHNTPGIIYGQTLIVDDNGNTIGHRHLRAPEILTLMSFSKGMMVCHQAFVAMRKISSGYSPKYKFSADYDWCIRCLQHSKHNVYMGEEPLIDYLSEGLTTRNRIPSLIERFKIMSYYYGLRKTVINHIGFIGRFAKRKIKSKKGRK